VARVCRAANRDAFVQALDAIISTSVQKLAACLAHLSANLGNDREHDSTFRCSGRTYNHSTFPPYIDQNIS
jgi:uncharacterized protein (DUF2461 family)